MAQVVRESSYVPKGYRMFTVPLAVKRHVNKRYMLLVGLLVISLLNRYLIVVHAVIL